MKITESSDKEHVQAVKEALKNNDGYCPCQLIKSEDSKCMCKEFREMESGTCHCGLYVKEK